MLRELESVQWQSIGLLQMNADYSCVGIHTESADIIVLYLGIPNLFTVMLQCSFPY